MSYLNWSSGKTVINYPEMNLKNVKIALVRVYILCEGLAKSWTVMYWHHPAKKLSVRSYNQ